MATSSEKGKFPIVGTKDWINSYLVNPMISPVVVYEWKDDIAELGMITPLNECQVTPGERLLIHKVCAIKHEHWCGHLHVPDQERDSWKHDSRLCMATRDKIFWPCGAKRIRIDGKTMEGDEFVKCKCGQFYPTKVEKNGDFTILTFCANDYAAVEVGMSYGEQCRNCTKLYRFYRAANGFEGDTKSWWRTDKLCIQCTPYKELCRIMMADKRIKFADNDYKEMKSNFGRRTERKNRSKLAVKEVNSPAIVYRLEVVEELGEWHNSISEMLATINLVYKGEFKIDALDRDIVVLSSFYGRKIFKSDSTSEMFSMVREHLKKMSML
uniref:Non-structural protein 1-2 n=1 Tax=Rotavirus G TaxID=183407 RepID=A0A2R2XE69_9REOV|nr:non-structural protein 1-2 [Rotavirus G]